jgi:hypothetical protein
MKPHLLMLLLLAIPPLISNILACENAEKTDPAPVTEKASSAPLKYSVTPAATPAAPAATATAPTPAPAKSEPAKGNGTSTGLKAWFIM